MMSANSDHTSTLDGEDLSTPNIPKTINHIEQCIAQAQARLEHLNSIIIPHAELTADFALPRSNELETEKKRIRTGDLIHVRQMAESYLMRLKEAERRNTHQGHRLTALETRLMMAESICSEQMHLNREIADESLRSLRQFSEAERKRIAVVKSANNRSESLGREVNRFRNQCDQQEQTMAMLREQTNQLNQETASLSQQLNRYQSDKNTLLLERDRLAHEAETNRNQVSERDDIIEELRERELRMTAELRERDALIERLGEERDRRDQEMVRNRRDFQNLLAEKEVDMQKLMETKKKEIIAELKATHRANIERYQHELRKQKEIFEEAMQEAYRETQKLAAQREEYFNNWRRLEESIEAHKRKLHAALSRKMVSKCTELVRDLKDIGADFDNRPGEW